MTHKALDGQTGLRRKALRLLGSIPLLSAAALGSSGAAPARAGEARAVGKDSLEQRLRRMEDLEEIRSLRNMYHFFINEKQVDRLPEIYTDDAVFSMDDSLEWVGVKQIVAGLHEVGERVHFLKHFIHGHEIKLAGDTGTGFAYLDARYAMGERSLVVTARYDDDYVRTAQGWRMQRTRVSLIYALPLGVGWAGKDLNFFSDGRP